VNTLNKKGATPLWMAALNGNKEIVEFLIEHGADANKEHKNGGTLLRIAKIRLSEIYRDKLPGAKQYREIIDLLKKKTAGVEKQPKNSNSKKAAKAQIKKKSISAEKDADSAKTRKTRNYSKQKRNSSNARQS